VPQPAVDIPDRDQIARDHPDNDSDNETHAQTQSTPWQPEVTFVFVSGHIAHGAESRN
jgi:hypothetical protein